MQKIEYIARDQRFEALDALRGCAALAVMIAHTLNYFPDNSFSNTLSASIASGARMLFNGSVAVSVFFIISGFVLSYHYFSHKKTTKHLALDIAYRTPRLFIPVILTGIPCFLLQYYTNAFFKPIDLSQFHYSSWIHSWNVDEWQFAGMIHFLLFQVFAFYDSNISFNVNLWTMKIEYTFSFLVFLLCGLYLRAGKSILFLLPIIIIMPLTWYSVQKGHYRELLSLLDFVIGAALAWTIVNASSFRALLAKLNRPIVMLTAIALCGISYHYGMGSSILLAINKCSALLFFLFSLSFSVADRKGEQNAFLTMLGNISFPLYLIHGSILYCVFTAITYYQNLLTHSGFLLGILISLLVTITASHLFTQHIEKPILVFAKTKTRSLL